MARFSQQTYKSVTNIFEPVTLNRCGRRWLVTKHALNHRKCSILGRRGNWQEAKSYILPRTQNIWHFKFENRSLFVEDASFYCVLTFSFCYERNYILLRIEGLYTSIIRVCLKCRKKFQFLCFSNENWTDFYKIFV